jgi:hypothetical protein
LKARGGGEGGRRKWDSSRDLGEKQTEARGDEEKRREARERERQGKKDRGQKKVKEREIDGG